VPRAVVAALVVLLVSGCFGGEAASVEPPELRRTVLQPGDLPGFERFDEGRQAIADLAPWAAGDPARFDRSEGWKARYRRRGGVDLRGPLVVESRSDRFASADGAAAALDAMRSQLAATRGSLSGGPDLGDGASSWATTQPGNPRSLRTYVLVWRHANVLASLTANGFEGRLRLEDVERLARVQDTHIVRVLG
jgi:hypothetical protein